MTNEEQIKQLAEKLLELIAINEAEKNSQQQIQGQQLLTSRYDEETVGKLTKLNVEVEVVNKIIRKADEVYGKTENYKYTTPLFEEYGKILKNK